MGCEENCIRKIELASEEALVNIIEHGYKNSSGKIHIRICECKPGVVELIFADYGPPFNPLKKQTSFNPLASLEERAIGGLGILFIRQYMDDVRYKREKEMNILSLYKKISH